MNDLNKIATLTTKAIDAIKVTNADGQISTVNIDDSNIIDLSTVWKKAEPVHNYLSSGTVVYTGDGKAIPYGNSIELSGVEANFNNIETGLQFNFSDKSTGYSTGLFVKTTYYPTVSGVTFDNGSKLPLVLTLAQLKAGKEIDNTKGSTTMDAFTSSGSKIAYSVAKMALNITPKDNKTISFTSDSRIVGSIYTVDWILDSVVVQ